MPQAQMPQFGLREGPKVVRGHSANVHHRIHVERNAVQVVAAVEGEI